MRHPMRIDPVWRPLLAPLGGTPARSYVEVSAEEVRFRFGTFFDQTFARKEVAGAGRATWRFIGGIGWRLGGGGTVGLIGSLSGIVEVRLRSPRRLHMLLIPFTCRRIRVSLIDPDAFLEDLGAAPSPASPR